MIMELYIGFHRPTFRDVSGRIDMRCWLGHVEIWGYNEDQTWFFLDPIGTGSTIEVMHRHDEVVDRLAAAFELCELIVKMHPDTEKFRFPLFGPMNCASIVGHMVGIRALLPSTLKRKVLRKGAVVIHEQAKGRSEGQSGTPA